MDSDESIVLNDAIRLIKQLAGRKPSIESKPQHQSLVPASTQRWVQIFSAHATRSAPSFKNQG